MTEEEMFQAAITRYLNDAEFHRRAKTAAQYVERFSPPTMQPIQIEQVLAGVIMALYLEDQA
jgi:hypothetical protein